MTRKLKAVEIEQLENTSVAGTLLGAAQTTEGLPEVTPCCPCTYCSVGTVNVTELITKITACNGIGTEIPETYALCGQ